MYESHLYTDPQIAPFDAIQIHNSAKTPEGSLYCWEYCSVTFYKAERSDEFDPLPS
jgi:hypothetical protein